MSKSEFSIKEVSRKDIKPILDNHHYLSVQKISKGFKCGVNFGLVKSGKVVGVCIFTGFPVPELVKGCFGLNRDEQEGFYELSRLCLLPEVQREEHNITSWFVSRALKQLNKNYPTRAVLSYSDTDHHEGTIYRACNFVSYGFTATKKDFWIEQEDGSFVKHSRGKVKGLKGEWRPRSRKRRFLIIYDKKLKCLWERA